MHSGFVFATKVAEQDVVALLQCEGDALRLPRRYVFELSDDALLACLPVWEAELGGVLRVRMVASSLVDLAGVLRGERDLARRAAEAGLGVTV